ncbi:MAG: hypothetical protein Ct9H90mP27_0830 [Gammaproteobacteria bacterium]|nr:MAG: hypothetical protein Ct9H90mP27_0830 [Gammaproteobacteria bacterium]
MTARQIEAGRRAMTRRVKRAVKYGLGFFSRQTDHKKKPLEVRQGKGKGGRENTGLL